MRAVRSLLLICAVIAAAPAYAQDSKPPAAGVLGQYLGEAVVMDSSVAGTAGNPHQAHYLPDLSQEITPAAFNKLLASQLSTFPIGSSSAGFAYTVDAATGAVTPVTQSFGPSFAERPVTIGKGKASFGLTFQHVSFDSFEGVDLKNGDISYLLRHNDCCVAGQNHPDQPTDGTPFFEGDLVRTTLQVDASTDTTALFGNYGVTNHWEVGVVLPIVHVQIDASGDSEILRLSTATNTKIHSWDGNGQTVRVNDVVGASSSGIGDVVFRTKYQFFDKGAGAGAAVSADLRLPTGDSDELLGTGGTQFKVLFIGAAAVGDRIFPHANVGYTFSSGEISDLATTLKTPTLSGTTNPASVPTQLGNVSLGVPDEFNYTFGADAVVHPRVTVAFDVIGRNVRDVERFALQTNSYQYRTANNLPLTSTDLEDFRVTKTGSLNLLLGAIGAKVNIAGTLIVGANVLFPMSDNGLKPNVTPTISFDYAF
jgi:hypothetical protein